MRLAVETAGPPLMPKHAARNSTLSNGSPAAPQALPTHSRTAFNSFARPSARNRPKASSSSGSFDSRAWPLLTYDPRRGSTIAERLSLQGNPALRQDWLQEPGGKLVDFVAFARSEGRFAAHFANGAPSSEIIATAADRLANWRQLQEMAVISAGG